MKKIILGVWIIVIILILYIGFAALSGWAINGLVSDESFVLFETENANDSIHVKVDGYEAFTFGPSKIELFINDDLVYETEISNDGGQLNDSNFDFEWINENELSITLKGDEQKDEHLNFILNEEEIWLNGVRIN